MRWRRIPTLVIIITNDVNVRTVLLLLLLTPIHPLNDGEEVSWLPKNKRLIFYFKREYHLIPQQHGGSTHLPLFVLS